MSTHKTFFGKLIAGVFSIFKSSAVKLWEDLTPEEQENLKHGSGVVNIINTHIDEAPEIIQQEIIAAFPDLDIVQLETELIKVCGYLGLTISGQTITDAITALKAYLNSKTGTIWQWASSGLAELISVALSKDTTIFAKISMLVEYVYRTYIQKPSP